MIKISFLSGYNLYSRIYHVHTYALLILPLIQSFRPSVSCSAYFNTLHFIKSNLKWPIRVTVNRIKLTITKSYQILMVSQFFFIHNSHSHIAHNLFCTSLTIVLHKNISLLHFCNHIFWWPSSNVFIHLFLYYYFLFVPICFVVSFGKYIPFNMP